MKLAHTVKKTKKNPQTGPPRIVFDTHQPSGCFSIDTGTVLEESCQQLRVMKTVMKILTIDVALWISSRVIRCGPLLQTKPIPGKVSFTPPQSDPHHQRFFGTRARSSSGSGGSPRSAKKYLVILPTTTQLKMAIKSSRMKAADGRIIHTTAILETMGGAVMMNRTSSKCIGTIGRLSSMTIRELFTQS